MIIGREVDIRRISQAVAPVSFNSFRVASMRPIAVEISRAGVRGLD